MEKKEKLLKQISELWSYLSTGIKYKCLLLLCFMILVSFVEVISLGALMPFLTLLVSPELVLEYSFIKEFFNKNYLSDPKTLLLPITSLFIVIIILSFLIRICALYFQITLARDIEIELGSKIFQKTIYQPYQTHAGRNSSEIISGVTVKAKHVVGNTIVPILTILGSSTTIIFVTLTLIYLKPSVIISLIFLLTLIYVTIYVTIKKILQKNSYIIAFQASNLIKTLSEGIGGIREIIINCTQKVHIKSFNASFQQLLNAEAKNAKINSSPRFFIETFAMIAIAISAYFISLSDGGIMKAIPILGVLVLGAQRVMPALNAAYYNLTLIYAHTSSLKDTLILLRQKDNLDNEKDIIALPFKSNIEFQNVSFNYDVGDKHILKNLNILVNKGDTIGIMGLTGSGKSTLINILMGLLIPSSGNILVDNKVLNFKTLRRWQLNITHVPQNIFLNDNSIIENIALGISKNNIDLKRIKKSVKVAQIEKEIVNFSKGYNTIVGENGIRLSGGQKQRIGIARAIYRDAKILVLDEATSALDNVTEAVVMKSIKDLKKNYTIIVVAHRLSTLKLCDKIIELENGTIKKTGSYKDFFD